MKKITLFVLTLMVMNFAQAQNWSLDETFALPDFHNSAIDLNSDGTILAIGLNTDGTYNNDPGTVRIYKKTNGTWNQMGNEITGQADGDYFGYSVAISNDGLTLAIGAHAMNGNGNPGYVKMYHYNGTAWVQKGSTLYGNSNETVGSIVKINGDGNIIALIAFHDFPGRVRVYQFNGSDWYIMGNEVDGAAQFDYMGDNLRLSDDGLTYIAGFYDNTTTYSDDKQIKVYTYNGTSWVQKGSTFNGTNDYGFVVNMDQTGNKIGFNNNGQVELYQYTGTSWTSTGTTNAYQYEINPDFSKIAIATYGGVEVYDINNSFSQIGILIDNPQYPGQGHPFSMSDDGNILAIDGSDDNNNYFTAVYSLGNPPVITSQPQSQDNICPDNTVTFNITATNTTTYQWQVSTDNANTWTDISDNTEYSGTNTDTLTVNTVTNMDEYQFRCVLSNPTGSTISSNALLDLDNEAPVINTVFTDINIDADWQCQASLPDYAANIDASDNCTALNDLTISQSPAPGTSITGDTNTITINVTDEMGNSVQTSFNVAVVDNSPPVISSPLDDDYIDATYNCQASLPDYTTGVVTADNCSSNISIVQNPAPGTSISGDNNTVTITVTDEVGNAYSASFNVTVLDETSPWYDSFPNTQQVDAGANCEAALPDYTTQISAHDNCTDTANLILAQNPAPGTMISGANNAVQIIITDEAGNQNTLNLDVSVVDHTAPVISTSPSNQTLDAGTNCEAVMPDFTGNVVATDNCTSTGMLSITQYPAAGDMVLDYTTATISVTDEAGNTSTADFMIYVVDNTPPVFLSTHDDQVIDAGDNCEAVLPDYTINVNADDNCLANFMPVQTPAPGTIISGDTNTVTLTIEDEAGNQTSVSFNVAVEDNSPPVILTYVDNQMVAATSPDGYTVQGTEFDIQDMSDNCGIASVINDFNNQSTLDGALLPIGVTDITWTVTDNAGNETTNSFYVEVTDYVGIGDFNQSGIEVYPNPFNEKISLTFGETQAQQVILQDITGKLIWQSKVNERNIIINTSGLQAGIYLLHISTKKGIITSKLIKE